MIAKVAGFAATFIFAFAILSISLLRSAAVRYVFSQSPSPTPDAMADEMTEMYSEIDYNLPYPGSILPDHFLWTVKVARDKLWLFITRDSGKKADVYLLLADKRLASSELLLERGKPELAIDTLTKAEKYLEKSVEEAEKAKSSGADVNDILTRLGLATLKHRYEMEEMLTKAPEDAKQVIVETEESYPKKLFERVKTLLMEMGKDAPVNPFEN